VLRSLPRHRLAAAAGLLVLLVAVSGPLTAQAPPPPAKKVLTFADCDGWPTATGMSLSRDGKYIAYNLIPGEGDGAVIVRQLTTGQEYRVARGGRPAGSDGDTPAGGLAGRLGGAALAGGGPLFTPDSKRVVFNLIPTRAELARAKADKAKGDAQPQPVLAVMTLADGQITDKIPQVRGFTIGGEGAGLLLYQKQARGGEAKGDAPAEGGKAETGKGGEEEEEAWDQPPGKKGGKGGFQGKGTGTAPAAGGGRTFGSDLVIRDLATGSERTLPDVAEYSLSRDGKVLVYTVASRKEEANGVYATDPTSMAAPVTIKAGPGRYSRLVWDEKQTRLAFLYDDAPAPSEAKTAPMPRPSGSGGTAAGSTATTQTPAPRPQPKWRVYVWERDAKAIASPAAAVVPMAPAGPTGGFAGLIPVAIAATASASSPAAEVLGPDTPGQRAGWALTGGSLSFSPDGKRLYVSTAPVRERPAQAESPMGEGQTPPAPKAKAGPGSRANDDKVDLDIWHWKDAYIQPMQKVRGNIEANRSYTAVLHLDAKEFRQLGDENLTVGPAGVGDWAIGSDDRKYLHLTGYGPSLRDYALVNVRTGETKPVLTGFVGQASLAPNGKYLLTFDGKDWSSLSVPDGKKVNLTEKLPVKFYNEDFDSPSEPPSHGLTGWTTDGKFVLLNDKYDIWKVAADGSSAENLTKSGRPQQIRFRRLNVAAETDEDADAETRRGIDLSRPMLLSAVNLYTKDTGFFRLEPGGTPKMLVMGARRYGTPVKARHADVYLLTAETFYDYPDYYVTGPDFHELKRVTDVNPKAREFNWGKAELVHYRSADGVPLAGILIKPENFDPSKKYPMVVYIYERLSDGLHQFRTPAVGTSINPTFYVSNGYLVFMPDIAYKVGSPGQSALKCVLPAISAVADKGFLDEKAIGIQGHSWGGYQIAYMVTQTDRFKAAAAGAPVSNMISAYGGIRWGSGLPRQFQYERTQSRIGGSLWEHPMRFIENSPIFMADRVTTPLLMLHNDQDDAVPWYQGIEYYLALRRLGKEVYLLNYVGEPHGLRRRANQRDYTMRMFQFFEHHLKGKDAPEWMAKGVPYSERDREKEQWRKLFNPERK
jgi:dipeptidyl aminopeptidase/acylaminoacyl peptidase